MKKIVKIVSLLTALVFAYLMCSVILDKYQLSNGVIRMHVVANSDSSVDQVLKLKVKDAVMLYLSSEMGDLTDISEAEDYLQENKGNIEKIARTVLASEGVDDCVSISLKQEPFPIRAYDTFTLPSGVYHSLRINIGNASGQNWWCVVFPTLCMNAAGSEDAAVSVFSDSLNHSIHGEDGYEVRFLLLDWLGSLENFFFKG